MAVLSDITELARLIEDAADAVAAPEPVAPPDIVEHTEILRRVSAAEVALPPVYRGAVGQPLAETFRRIGARGWDDIRRRDPGVSGIALLGYDLVQAVTQRGEGYLPDPTDALQEVVSDLYDGFLSAADRSGVKPPDHGVAPPLVKWGRPAWGPYAWTAPAAQLYACEAGLVNMPPAFAQRGLAAWGAIGHETSGHHVLHADEGLREALAEAVREKILASTDQDLKAKPGAPEEEKAEKDRLRTRLADYWAERIDESASDVMGVLNMGPAAAVALVAYFRGLRAVSHGVARLSAVGLASSEHPAPLARGFLMAEAIGQCSFAKSAAWRAALRAEIRRDVPEEGFVLAGERIPSAAVEAAAANAARAILNERVAPLEQKRLRDIQDWRQHDEEIVEALTVSAVLGGRMPPDALQGGLYAAHAVAAGVMGALLTGQTSVAQARMIALAADMHRKNPSWSALVAAHPGDFETVHLPGAAAEIGAAAAARAPRHSRGGGTGGGHIPVLATDGGHIPVPATDGGHIPVLATGGGWIPVKVTDGGHIVVKAGGIGADAAVALSGPGWPLAGRAVIRAVLGTTDLGPWQLAQIGLERVGEGAAAGYAIVADRRGALGDRVTQAAVDLILGPGP